MTRLGLTRHAPASDSLLIDDDSATAGLLGELLCGRGFKLRVALDGRDVHLVPID
jgi:DNA-binding response OmpR family regulator